VWVVEKMSQENNSLKCSACDNPYHEASGHRISDTMRYCGPCAKSFATFWKGMTRRKWGKNYFYDYAVPPKGEEE
jgi:hypothetical protein